MSIIEKPLFRLKRKCPYCSFETKTYVPNIKIPWINLYPAIWWCSSKLGFHIGRSHYYKYIKIWGEGDVLETVRFIYTQPDMELRDKFKDMKPEEIARKIIEEEEIEMIQDTKIRRSG